MTKYQLLVFTLALGLVSCTGNTDQKEETSSNGFKLVWQDEFMSSWFQRSGGFRPPLLPNGFCQRAVRGGFKLVKPEHRDAPQPVG